MSVDQYRKTVERHQKELARLQQEKSKEAAKAADEQKKANTASLAVSRTTSSSTIKMRLNESQRHADASVRHQKKVAELESKIAREQTSLLNAQRSLSTAEQQEQKKTARENTRAAQVTEGRMRSIATLLTRHSQLHAVTQSKIERLRLLPEKIAVLFLAANPLDQEQLRLDEEVRSIGEMIRKSEHRDAIQLESRWAVRPLDVLQAINECSPTVVHFSGHGSDSDEIVFQDEMGQAKPVTKDAIVQTIAAASGKIQLIFFNTCFSAGQAEAVVGHIPAAIGMNTSIGDSAARVFSAQFYSALGFGHDLAKAFQQAKAALMLEGIPEETTPELFIGEGFDAGEMVLVRPPDR